MAAEIQVRVSLSINKGNISYGPTRPNAFAADFLGNSGPTPGMVVIATSITVINLANLATMGGWCRIENYDQTNFVIIGAYDADAAVFYPVLDLLPGESIVVRLSRFLTKELTPSAGTGSVDIVASSLAAKADIAPCNLLVEAFDK
jgi:hypothetical protein